MIFFYNLLIHIYYAAIRFAAIWNKKARQWIDGRKNLFEQLQRHRSAESKTAWFHCASLGEFEQGRPLIEAFRSSYPEYKILLTFFSPSGYEIRKNYDGADLVFYLPLDTKKNALRFIEVAKPDLVFFIKYEFWFHYLNTLQQKNIPIYIVSANFRSDQIFFKWYGAFNRCILSRISHFFVQNETSLDLLKSIHINEVTVSGDTRFDRVLTIASERKKIPLLEEFKGAGKIIIAGSTWPADHKLISKIIVQTVKEYSLKFIIAPHEIDGLEIRALINNFKNLGLTCLRYSEADLENIKSAQILIIDSIGLLSGLYQYGELAYIGGGFGKGIHNILEAATFGLPLFFGPQYARFQEAHDLIALGGAFPIEHPESFQVHLKSLFQNPDKLEICSKICLNYTAKKQGATQTILNYIKMTMPDVT